MHGDLVSGVRHVSELHELILKCSWHRLLRHLADGQRRRTQFQSQ